MGRRDRNLGRTLRALRQSHGGRSLLAANLLVPSHRRGVLVVDGATDEVVSGVGGWALTMDGAWHWTLRAGGTDPGTIEAVAVIVGVGLMRVVDPTLGWTVYSDRANVARELAGSEAGPAVAFSRIVDRGGVAVRWASRESRPVVTADALAQAGKVLPGPAPDPWDLATGALAGVVAPPVRIDDFREGRRA